MSTIVFPTNTQEQFEDFLKNLHQFYQDKYGKVYNENRTMELQMYHKAQKYERTSMISAGFMFGLLILMMCSWAIWNLSISSVIATILFIIALIIFFYSLNKGFNCENSSNSYEHKNYEIKNAVHNDLDKINLFIPDLSCFFDDDYNILDWCRDDDYNRLKMLETLKKEKDIKVKLENGNIVFNTIINGNSFKSNQISCPNDRDDFDVLTKASGTDTFNLTYLDKVYNQMYNQFDEIKNRKEDAN